MKKLLAIMFFAASLPCLAQSDAEVKYIVVKGNMAGCPSPDVPLWQLEEDLEELIRELQYRNVIRPVPEEKTNIIRDSRPDS